LCGSSKYKVLDAEIRDQGNFTIARCSECSLVYVRETFDDVSPDYISLDLGDIDADRIWLQSKHKEPAFRQFIKTVRKLRPFWAASDEKPSLVDIGCGTGGFLGFASDFFCCYGFDASAAQVEYAQNTFPNVRVARSVDEYVSSINSLPASFELFALWDVLEHIRKPIDFFNNIVPKLSKDGMVFISVPNANPTVVKRKLGRLGYPGEWHADEHVVYYTPSTLRIVLENVGLKIVQCGSTAIYPRPLSCFEILRRGAFALTRYAPNWAPQIYVFAARR
jgi:2-polyprenyl-3-methyl-5-hydroxy-6-metoxy-1,4-benzoquinol methylase